MVLCKTSDMEIKIVWMERVRERERERAAGRKGGGKEGKKERRGGKEGERKEKRKEVCVTVPTPAASRLVHPIAGCKYLDPCQTLE